MHEWRDSCGILNAAVTAFEAGGRRGRAPICPVLLRMPEEAKSEEKELKIWEEKRASALADVIKTFIAH